MSALAVIFVAGLTQPAAPGGEVPALIGAPKTVSTPMGEVDIAAVRVYSAGALVELRAELAATPGELLARPDQVLAPAPEHDEYAMTLRTRSAGSSGPVRRCRCRALGSCCRSRGTPP